MKRPRTAQDVAGRGLSKPVAGATSLDILDLTRLQSSRERINRKWARYYRTLLKLREQLLQERRERLAEVSQPLESHSMDLADSATDELDHNLALAELSAGQDSLREVDAAIRRILDGTYGVCEQTGERIPAARLKAIPWTRFARDVEARLEKNGANRGPHLGQVSSMHSPLTGNLEAVESVEEEEPRKSAAADEALKILVPRRVSPASEPGNGRHL